MSALPPKTDIAERDRRVRFVPIANIRYLFDHVVSAGNDSSLWNIIVRRNSKTPPRTHDQGRPSFKAAIRRAS
jgi:hypothetical protein